ncbi:AMP-binding protein [Pinisolibacter sp.]|uniref:AMP-binding protein n=1 Tax=Pinisolibacter sp. TaxID=2172024 RepID=UPI002FDCAC38
MGLWDTAADKLALTRDRRAVARRLAELDVAPTQTLRDEIEEWAAEHRDRLALVSADGVERLSYEDLVGRAARWARWCILHGVARGEPVALLMANRPERVAAWLGVAASGAVAALLDPTVDGETLAAAIAIVAPRHVVVDGTLLPLFETAAPHLTSAAAVWVHGPHTMAYPRLDEALAELSPERLRPADRRPIAATDTALWIAGATGGATRLDHRRVIRRLHAAAAALGLTRDDRLHLPDLGLADPAAALAACLAPTAGGVTVLTATSDEALGPDATTTARIEPGDPTIRIDRLRSHRGLLWRGDELRTASGDLLWRDDA